MPRSPNFYRLSCHTHARAHAPLVVGRRCGGVARAVYPLHRSPSHHQPNKSHRSENRESSRRVLRPNRKQNNVSEIPMNICYLINDLPISCFGNEAASLPHGLILLKYIYDILSLDNIIVVEGSVRGREGNIVSERASGHSLNIDWIRGPPHSLTHSLTLYAM